MRWLPWPAPGQLAAILTGVLAAAGPVVWNAILRATPASQFFTDTPLRLLPASWQTPLRRIALATATSSGSGHWPPPPARHSIGLTMLCGLAAFLVEC